MPNTNQPAGATGGSPGASTYPALAELPAKVRVHALAKLLELSSRQVLDALAGLGEPARSPQSSVDRDLAWKVADALLGSAPEPGEPEPEPTELPAAEVVPEPDVESEVESAVAAGDPPGPAPLAPVFAAAPVFLPPAPPAPPARPAVVTPPPQPAAVVEDEDDDEDEPVESDESDVDTAPESDAADLDEDGGTRRRRRRGRRGRGRGKGGQGDDATGDGDEAAEDVQPAADATEPATDTETDADDAADDGEGGGTRRRRRRRRRKGSGDGDDATSGDDDPPNTVVHVRDTRDEKGGGDRQQHEPTAQDEVRSVRGSTRLEAKRQRRRDGREAGRRRVPILSESEFLARREAVDRKMVVNQRGDSVQIGVLEDGVLVEHFVTSAGSGSLVGNVYLGRVQNVLPSMEAAFVDIGRGRNAVLYAGEVDWDAAGLEGKARKIEQALSTGDSVLVQVTKDPVGHKGARLTTQISLPGRFLVYVPGGGATGISRKLPDTERKRLKDVLKRVVPEDAGVIIRTASEGVSEEELGRDVRRLRAQWEIIQEKAAAPHAKSPQLLYEEPDLLIKVVRDLFTEDFSALTVQGDSAWDTIEAYVTHVAPDLVDRLKRHVGNVDVFTVFRIDEQILKALDRKVWLPSGGYLVVDRTEAMTVIDVNTGKFTGSGGNLEETVTRNNLEAAEEIVRQLRLRDIGGIIVVDFIDMVLESNRDLVLRRLTECLGRDRTRHQVAEVTSLGLVQMTRKRVGTGLLEAFSTTCEHCRGRGVLVSTTPVHAHAAPNGTPDQSSVAVPAASNGHHNGNGHAQQQGQPSQPAQQHQPAQQQSGSGTRRHRHRGHHHEQEPTPAPAPEPVATPEPVAATPEPAAAPPATVQKTPAAEPRAVEPRAADQAGPGPTDQPAPDQPTAEPPAEPERAVERAPEPAAEPAEEPVAEAVEESEEEPVVRVVDEPVTPSGAHANGHQPAVAAANPPRPTRRRAASRPAGPPSGQVTPV